MRKVGLQKTETLAHLVDCLQILVIELARLLGMTDARSSCATPVK